MTTVKYKTNINCNGCIKSVTPFLNELDNIETWEVDQLQLCQELCVAC